MSKNKKLINWLHLYPGLVSAVIVFFVCITGTILVYSDEIIELSAGNSRYVAEVKDTKISVDELINIIKQEYPDREAVSYLVAYKDPHRSVRFNTYSKEQGLRMVYIDQYTGKILKDDPTIYFFYITAHLHNSFLWGKTGQWIIDIATLIFVIELITGLFLWWPKRWNRTARNGAFKIKWQSTAKRLNYDLHKVLGFYALGVLLLLSLTGLIIAFEPVSTLILKSSGADTGHQMEEEMPQFQADKPVYDLNLLIDKMFTEYPQKEEVQIATYKLASSGYYLLRLADRIGLKSAQQPIFKAYDRFSGEEVSISESALRHEKIENMIWVLHMGNWMGAVGKLITFIAGLIATSLPVTGFFIWWSKKRKKNKPK